MIFSHHYTLGRFPHRNRHSIAFLEEYRDHEGHWLLVGRGDFARWPRQRRDSDPRYLTARELEVQRMLCVSQSRASNHAYVLTKISDRSTGTTPGGVASPGGGTAYPSGSTLQPRLLNGWMAKWNPNGAVKCIEKCASLNKDYRYASTIDNQCCTSPLAFLTSSIRVHDFIP